MDVKPNQLKAVAEFSEVPEDQLQWLIDNSEVKRIDAGNYIFSKGDAIDKMYVILEGKALIKVAQNGSYKQVATLEAKSISGYLPFSRATSALGFGEVVEDCLILETKKAEVLQMAREHYELTESLVHTMTNRTREFAKQNVQAEKMMALGKLSAGLAHELNNPVSAISRSAQELKKQLGHTPEKFKNIMALKLDNSQTDNINSLMTEKMMNKPTDQMSLMERNDAEDMLEQWLTEHNVARPYELTETLLEFDFSVDTLTEISKVVGENNFPTVLKWIENNLTTEKIVNEIQEASERVDNLVKSIKSFTHMDQNPEPQPADILKGINDTLTMLNHKVKSKGIQVDKKYAANLPKANVIIGEINQVWTNLIDNAIDAMERNGMLEIAVSEESACIYVKITDDGEGIPQENLSRIFDPFFTTKAIGKGVGMGLELVQRIVSQHRGKIDVKSEQGKTTFTVGLPTV